MQDFFLWIGKHGPNFLLISVVVVLIRRRYLTGPLRYVALFVGLAALGEIIAYVTAHVLHMNNLYILHIYTVLECIIVMLFYWRFFQRFYPRLLVPGLMVGYTTFAVLNSLFIQPITQLNSYARGLEALLIMGLALLCYYKMLTELTTKRLDKHPIFWINTGMLLYFAGNLFFLILGNALVVNLSKTLIMTIFGLHTLLMVVMHLMISVGLWYSPRLR